MSENLYPLLFEPVLKSYIWGGRNLESRLGRKLPAGKTIAESWEIAAHSDGDCLITNGVHAGRTLSELQAELGLALCGSANTWAVERGKFPLLVKLLDATQALSVQVHPDDDYARAHEGNELGKTEMWVVLHAAPSARLVLGVKAGTSKEKFRQAAQHGGLADCLHYLPVRSGDHVCVPAGTLHAIMDGLLIAEIQQNSNTTYRVYDWDRLDANGKSRPLHLDKALDVINFDCVEPAVCPATTLPSLDGIRRELLCRNRYFSTERLWLPAGSAWTGNCDGSSLEIWGCLEGSVVISAGNGQNSDSPATSRQESFDPTELAAIRFGLLPAAMGSFVAKASTDALVLRTLVEPA